MNFQKWLTENYQRAFPFATEEDPPDLKRISRFKSRDNYINAMSKGGKKTESAAKELISAPIGLFVPEEIIGITPNAFVIPAATMPSGYQRSEHHIAFVHVQNIEPSESVDPKYQGKRRHRLLAYWQKGPTFTKSEALEKYNRPVGGVSIIGSYIDTVWVDEEFRSPKPEAQMPSLYKALMMRAKNMGYPGLAPDDDLTSKSFRAAQAKHDWNRGWKMMGKNPPS